MPFMAIGLLQGQTSHIVSYDLESLFNVLLAISILLRTFGDSDQNHGLVHDETSKLHSWFTFEQFDLLGMLKFAHFMSIEETIFEEITEPFRNLIPCFDALHKVLFPSAPHRKGSEAWTSSATCEDFTKILDRALVDQTIVADARLRHSSTENFFNAKPPQRPKRKKRAAPADISSNRPMTRSRSSLSSPLFSNQNK
jgi:hypothetical protein